MILFGNFQSVVVLFDNRYMIGRFIPGDKILTTIISKESSDLTSTLKILSGLGKDQDAKEKLKQVPSVSIEKQSHEEKLVTKKYTMVEVPIGEPRQSKG